MQDISAMCHKLLHLYKCSLTCNNLQFPMNPPYQPVTYQIISPKRLSTVIFLSDIHRSTKHVLIPPPFLSMLHSNLQSLILDPCLISEHNFPANQPDPLDSIPYSTDHIKRTCLVLKWKGIRRAVFNPSGLKPPDERRPLAKFLLNFIQQYLSILFRRPSLWNASIKGFIMLGQGKL